MQGADIVLDGIENRQAERLGDALRLAVEAANGGGGRSPAPAGNMEQSDADAIALVVGRSLAQPR